MKKKNMIKNISRALVLLCIFAIGTSAKVKADNVSVTQDMGKQQAVDTALKNSTKMLKVDRGLITIKRNYDKYKEISTDVVSLKKSLEQYKSAYSMAYSAESMAKYKGLGSLIALFTQAEQIPDEITRNATIAAIVNSPTNTNHLTKVQAQGLLAKADAQIAELKEAGNKLAKVGLTELDPTTGGDKPKILSPAKTYATFVYLRNIPWYIAQDMMDKTKLQREVIQSATDVLVKQGYDTILYAEDGYNLTKQLYDKQVKDYGQLVKKYEVGSASELEKNLAQIELQKSKLNLDNLQRQVENGKTKLNQSLAVNLKDNYNFKDKKIETKDPLTYDEYLTNAMKNRAEILDADITIAEKQKIFDDLQGYFNKVDVEYLQAEQEIEQAKLKKDQTSKQIETEMQSDYLDVKQKQSALKLSSQKVEQANNQYNVVNISYKTGMQPLSMLWLVELGVNKAQMDNNKALRDYNNALYALDANCKIGTKYVMERIGE
ncbi:TolC family protein [Clostridium sp.]|uniref:TolC family protein n=1 Tax=Clostridium sp. TaxID=1506 RepID=UPI003D6CD4AA